MNSAVPRGPAAALPGLVLAAALAASAFAVRGEAVARRGGTVAGDAPVPWFAFGFVAVVLAKLAYD